VRWQNGAAANACGTSCFGSVLGQTAANAAGTRPDFDAVNAAFHPRIPRYDIYEHTQDRLGATLSLQWRPSDATDVTLDVLYADHNSTRTESFLESPVFSTTGASGIQDVDVSAYQIQGGTLVYGVFDDVDIRSENRYDELSSQVSQASITLSHDFSNTLRAEGFVGRSQAAHSNPVQTTLLWDRNNVDGYVYDYRGDNRLPLISYGGAAVTDPSFWTLSQIRLRPQYVDNTFDTIYANLELDANDWLTVSGGVNWKNYDFESVELRRSNGTTANRESIIPGFAAGTANGLYAQILSLNGSGLNLPAGLTTSWAAPNVQTAGGLWNLYDPTVFQMGIEPALGNNFSISEEDRGAFVQADWSTEIAGMPFRGNAGIRYVETTQSSTGYTFSAGLPVQTTVSRTYSDTLPSINMVLEPTENLLLRFGAAEMMTRPNLIQLNPGAAVSVSGSNRTVTAGNPELDPFRARSYDVSLEWYFRPEALISVAYFYKDIDSFVQTVRETGAFTGNALGLPDSVAIAACGAAFPATCSPSDTNWQFSLPRNTPGGPLSGWEVGVQMPFFFLPGVWSNFGVAANFTHVESEIDYVDALGNPTVTADLTGLSAESWNATLYYEDERFSARVSGAFRSDYLTTIPGRNGNTSESTAETLNIDFASSYAISDRLRLTLEGLNLTDEVSDQFLDPDNRSSFYHHYGRQVLAGIRFTY
jgi:TonB-dependent receptor